MTRALLRGEKVRHTNGVTVTPYTYEDEPEIVEVWDPEAALHVDVRAQELTTWLALRFPDHFLRDGSCVDRCGEE